MIWGWFITGTFTMMVAMSLAEICSAYPTTGGLYFWTSRLAPGPYMPLACWLTGWFNWIGLCFGTIYSHLSFITYHHLHADFSIKVSPVSIWD